MKTLGLILFMVVGSLNLFGQQYKTVELKPIAKQGWRYYYDFKRLGGPIALEVPLIAINDEETFRLYKTSKTIRAVGQALGFIPLFYIISIPENGFINPSTFWILVGSSLAAQLGMETLGHFKLGKAIDRYNLLIFQPSSNSLGLQIKLQF
ncbi:MAG: hypothetical protein KIT62_10010 [Cyclobacteriaceae bacterium]|nr:hypothetical protein [Cyclobacteriaceae bacterium]